MKIGIFGRTKADNDKIIQTTEKIGKFLAHNGHTLITGGTEGYPHIAAMSALKAGGEVISYAVGLNLEDHQNFHQVDLSKYTKIIYQNKYFGDKLHTIDNYLRSLEMCLEVDMAIIIGGRVGTMYEVTLLSGLAKNIFILEKSGGVTNKTIKTFAKEGHKEKSKIIFFKNTKDLEKIINSI